MSIIYKEGRRGLRISQKGVRGMRKRSLRMRTRNRLMMNIISGQNGSATTGIVISCYTYLLGLYRINRVEIAEEFGKSNSNHENIA